MSYRTSRSFECVSNETKLGSLLLQLRALQKQVDEITIPKPKPQHAINCAARVGGHCFCDYKSVFGK